MKILQISTSSTGGAGIAAKHLFGLLSSSGIQSKLITRDSLTKSRGTIFNLNSLAGKFITAYQTSMLREGYDLLTPISMGQRLMQEIASFEPDLIHIHNWYNLMSLDQIALVAQKYPLVFTLHDERLLTGGCHITLGCDQFKNSCKSCPAIVHGQRLISQSYNKSLKVFGGIQRVGVIAPSHWLMKRAKLSPVLNEVNEFEVISNVMTHYVSDSLCRNSDTPDGVIRVVFVAADLSTKVKNLTSAVEALNLYCRMTKSKSRISLTVVGRNFSKEIMNDCFFEVNHESYLDEPSLMKLFRESDVLLISSQSENSPNVISEAQLNGLIVVASAVGGIPELVQDGKTGFLADSTPAGIADALLRYEYCESKDEIRRLAIESARERCDYKIILDRHLDLYERVARL